MNKLRVKSKTEYEIEVNDKGETISFDLSDPALLTKFLKAFEDIEKLLDEAKAQIDKIETDKSVDFLGESISSEGIKSAEILNEFFKKSRVAMDIFLGDGACEKIFGNKNWITMYNDLADQLEPHFEKMGLDFQKHKSYISKKYIPQKNKALK